MVLELRCPDCGHGFRSLVMEGTKVPEEWVCSACGGRRAYPLRTQEGSDHPFAGGQGCACCG
ncbi:MAG TPA: hypothetical protein VM367_17895 [Pseudonocardia sp.]|jgi:hypothetical protein|nr:hypothetical protein [Pseudonocardia sp.]